MKKARKSELSSGSSKLDFRPVPEIESFTNLSFLKADSGRGARLSAAPKGPNNLAVSRVSAAGTEVTRLHLVDVVSNDHMEPPPLHPRPASATALRVLVRPFERKGEPRDAP